MPRSDDSIGESIGYRQLDKFGELELGMPVDGWIDGWL